MPKFSTQFQRSHDIDWFAKVGKFGIHAMSFGGLLPQPVNERNRNFILMRKSFQVEQQIKQLVYNNYYIDRRLNRYQELYPEQYDRQGCRGGGYPDGSGFLQYQAKPEECRRTAEKQA